MITLYTQPQCSKCRVIKMMLTAKHIDFTEKTDNEFLMAKGFQSTPILNVDDKFLQFDDAISFIKGQ